MSPPISFPSQKLLSSHGKKINLPQELISKISIPHKGMGRNDTMNMHPPSCDERYICEDIKGIA